MNDAETSTIPNHIPFNQLYSDISTLRSVHTLRVCLNRSNMTPLLISLSDSVDVAPSHHFILGQFISYSLTFVVFVMFLTLFFALSNIFHVIARGHRRSRFRYERSEYEHCVSVMIRESSLRSYSGTVRLMRWYDPYQKQPKRIAVVWGTDWISRVMWCIDLYWTVMMWVLLVPVRNLSALCTAAPCSGG